MQQRFCTCGQVLWVTYVLGSRAWQSVFFSNRPSKQGQTSCCPCCGAPLDIDSLS